MDSTNLYRAVWRWHFYAGLFTLPFLGWLAITGGLYLYKPELEGLIYRDWLAVPVEAGRMPLDRMVESVGQQTGGRVTQIMKPGSAGESWRMTVVLGEGSERTAFVHPHDGRVAGTTAKGGALQTVRDLHSLIITGPIGNALIEIAGGWAILLVLSGLYLWWPRGGSRALGLRGNSSSRTFWRDLHASVGALAGAVLLFLAVTGMPWSGIWGKTVQKTVTAEGWGRPPAPKPGAGMEHRDHRAAAGRETLPWAMQEAHAPTSHGPARLGPEAAAHIAKERGFTSGWTMTLPSTTAAPYLITAAAARVQDAHILYLDATDGAVLQDMGYADFGPGAKAIEWGIQTHQGLQYGEPNRLVMLAGCIAMLLLALSAPVMWWKRRPNGRLSAPPRPASGRDARGAAALMLGVGALFPLTAATMLLGLLCETVAGRLRHARAG